MSNSVTSDRMGHIGIQSAVYTGSIRHRRFMPNAHAFNYPLFMLYIDLDELPELFSSKWFCSLERFNLVSFKRKDYFAPEQPDLKQAVITRVTEDFISKGHNPPEIAHVRILMHARYLNVVFNPVVFYYCFDDQENLLAILAEITNTPWAERHDYVLPVNEERVDMGYRNGGNNKHIFSFGKKFHVSPFNPMNMDYRWVFGSPKENLVVHMENTMKASSGGGNDSVEKHFDATLNLERKSFEDDLSKTLIQYPIITVKVILGIYWQAFRLWVKRNPFYDHPKHSE